MTKNPVDYWYKKYLKEKQKNEQMIDKAWEYIDHQLNLPSDFEVHFRKAMEERL